MAFDEFSIGFGQMAEEISGQEDPDRFQPIGQKILEGLFGQQLDFVVDPAQMKVGITPRQGGKTTVGIAAILYCHCQIHKANTLFSSLTRVNFKSDIWPKLKERALELELCGPDDINESDLTIKINGGILRGTGMDTVKAANKKRGPQYDIIIMDEVGSQLPDTLTYMVDTVLTPTLAARKGPLIMISTPGEYCAGEFFDATNDDSTLVQDREDGSKFAKSIKYQERHLFSNIEHKWSLHTWHTKDNWKAPQIWEAFEKERKTNNIQLDDPSWLREKEAKWVIQGKGFVSAFNASKNIYEGTLPPEHIWEYCLGIDTGFRDPTAFVIAAHSRTSPYYYIVEDYEQPEMDVQDVYEKILELKTRYNITDMVGDSASLIYWESFRKRYKLNVKSAVKLDKVGGVWAHTQLLNTDLRSGRCLIRKGLKLTKQLPILKWKEDGRTVNNATPDHLFDGLRYCFRYLQTHYARLALAPDDQTRQSIEHWRQEQTKEQDKHIRTLLKKGREARLEPDLYSRKQSKSKSIYDRD